MSIDSNHRRTRKQHKPTLCPTTKKRRFREHQDATFAVRDAKFARASAAIDGRVSPYRIARSYKCSFCNGWHTTSQPSFSN